MNLDRVLQRLPDITLRLDARNEVVIQHQARSIACGQHALELLEVFTQPMTTGEALAFLKPRWQGTQEWLMALRTVQQLVQEGILVEPGFHESRAGFDHASLHIEMLQDEERTNAFLRAIRDVVKLGQSVVEIGTGTGVLATAAAQAGAAKVYAIESGLIQHQAAVLFRRNSVQDRVQLLSGWSTSLSLPEQVDVLVAEILGHDALGEDLIGTFHDAIRRFLKPSGVVIPARVEVWGELVKIPKDVTSQHRFETMMLAEWQKKYGVDFSSLAEMQPDISFRVDTAESVNWTRISEPKLITQARFYPKAETYVCPDVVELQIRESGEVNGLLIWFKAYLTPEIVISTDPAVASATCHWRNVVRLFAKSRMVNKGDNLKLDCRNGYLKAGWLD